ncbi:MAG: hypothetical protein HY303_12760 [Candidatus Wallbacteria bacterium]|nr:hypothetical protein [Candidatus Wallbacteria bacterium]
MSETTGEDSGPDAMEARQWFIASRFQEFAGESRANLCRIVALGSFYIVELITFRGLDLGVVTIPKEPTVDLAFHGAVTAICVAWVGVAVTVASCLHRRVFPEKLKFLSTGADVTLLTLMLLLADGPRSPLLVGYFLLISLAGLRLDLQLVRATTLACVLGYLTLLGNARWYRQALRVPKYHELIFVLALVLSGVFLGQIIRRVRLLSEDYSNRLRTAEGSPE